MDYYIWENKFTIVIADNLFYAVSLKHTKNSNTAWCVGFKLNVFHWNSLLMTKPIRMFLQRR